MCGRYILLSELQELLMRYDIEETDAGDLKYGEIFPTNLVPVIVNDEGNKLKLLRWGISFKGSKSPVINARAETITEKPLFKNSFYQRRCIIPANAFYEWKKVDNKKIKHIINVENQKIFSMAGIYNLSVDERNNPVWSFVIITTEPNKKMSEIHNRMPVILRPEDEELWLKGDIKDISALRSLLMPINDDCTLINPA